jgi:diguanylate cyclase (GGDEF)-like protein
MRQIATYAKEIWAAATYVGDADTALARAKLASHFQMLRRKIPILHLIILVNSLGLAIAHVFHAPLTPSTVLPGGILAICIIRFIWRVESWGAMEPQEILRTLKGTLIDSALLAIGFGSWGLMLFEYDSREHQAITAIFVFMSSIGAAYCLGSLPKAARSMVFFCGLPIAVRLFLTGDMLLMGLGLNLLFVSVLVLRMLGVHFTSMDALIESRESIFDQVVRSETAEAEAFRNAMTDALTGLANRRALTQRLEELIQDSNVDDQTDEAQFGVAIMDLNGFKPINDTYGHAAGDEVLVTVASRLEKLIGDDGLVARLGGDEFAALMTTTRSESDCMVYGRRICDAINEPITVGDTPLRISGSCGFAMFPVSGVNGELLINRADTALYHCKRTRSADVAVFQLDLEEHLRRRMKVDQALRSAIENNEIGVAFQPIFDLQSGKLISFEALARWHHPALGEVAPDEFIESAEQSGLICELTNRIIEKGLAAAQTWNKGVAISINFSAAQIGDPAAGIVVLSALNKAGIAPERMIVEITETALLSDLDNARRVISDLRGAGVQVHIDDFGTGHCALNYLQELEFDMVKIDKSFVRNAVTSADSRDLLRGIRELCAAIRIPCIAEGIENEDQLAAITELGYQYGQGNGLCEPVSPMKARELSLRVANQGSASTDEGMQVVG